MFGGGRRSSEQVKNAFRILMSDPSVRAGVHQYFRRHIAPATFWQTGVVAAAKDLQLKVPVCSAPWKGTNVENGAENSWRESGLNFTIADGMKDGAEKVVAPPREVGDERSC